MRLAKQYSHSGLFRFVKDLAAPDNWKNMLESITEIDSDIKEDLEFLGGHALKEIGNTIENLQRQMSASLDLITEARDEAKVRSYHSSTFPPLFPPISCPSYPSAFKALILHSLPNYFQGIQTIAIT
jgi:hypothetical protein